MYNIDNGRYKKMFFEETEECLHNLNMRVLELEEDKDNVEILEAIFRKIHTLKGLAGAMGYDSIESLSHEMENVFAQILEKRYIISEEIINTIFKSIDRIEEMTQNLKEKRPIVNKGEDLIEILSLYSNVDKEDINKEVIEDKKLSQEEKMEILESDDNVYDLNIKIEEDTKLKGARAFLVLKKLGLEGEILKTSPSKLLLTEGNYDEFIRLVYVSKLSEVDIEKLVYGISDIEKIYIEDLKEKLKKENIEKISEIKNKNEINNNILKVDINKVNNLMDLISDLSDDKNKLKELNKEIKNSKLEATAEEISDKIDLIRKLVLSMKMQPIKVALNRFPRMLRDMSKILNKEVDFKIIGGETEVDEIIVREIDEPLVHILKNAIDHGIELRKERLQKGKSSVGTIILKIEAIGNQIIISIEDDGRGIDYFKILREVENYGIDTDSLSEEEIQNLIFQQGLTTRENINNISGRGVGMDAVKEKIDSLNGSIEVESEKDLGTKFTIKIPISSSCIKVFLYKVDNITYGLDYKEIKGIRKIARKDLGIEDDGINYFSKCNSNIKILDIYDRINSKNKIYQLLTLDRKGKNIGILVDDVFGKKDIIIEGKNIRSKDYIEGKTLDRGEDIFFVNREKILDIS